MESVNHFCFSMRIQLLAWIKMCYTCNMKFLCKLQNKNKNQIISFRETDGSLCGMFFLEIQADQQGFALSV